MFKAIYPAVLGLSLLAGCSMAPEYQRPASPVASSYPDASPQAETGSEALPQWRSFYTHQELQHLIQLALQHNRDLRVSELNTERVRAYYRIQNAARLPTLNATASDTRARTPADLSYTGESGISDTYAVGLQMPAYELDFFGRILSLKDQALQQYLATEEAERSAEISLVAAVANQYHQLVALKEQAKLAGEAMTSAKRAYDINQDSFDAGVGTELDLKTAEAQYQAYRASQLAYLDQVNQAQNALVWLVGSELPTLAADSSLLQREHAPVDLPVGLPSELLTRRPDIRAAEHTLKAANANIGAARAAFFPSVRLTAFGGTASAELSDLFKSGSAQWSFTPQITLPIFTGGRNKANLEVANVEQRIELAQYERAIQTAFREVADALAVSRTIDQRIDAQSARVAAAQRRSTLSNQRFDAGVDSYLPVLLAQQELFSAQRDLVQAKLTKLNNQSALFAALGGGLKSDF